MLFRSADDARTFTLTLKQPFGLVLDALAKPSGYAAFILPERFAKMQDNDKDFEPIGSGPFIFRKDQWRPGVRSVFEKNRKYVPRDEPPSGLAGGKVVKIDRVEWVSMPDVNTGANAMMSGEIDIIESLAFDVMPQLRADKNITMKDRKSTRLNSSHT